MVRFIVKCSFCGETKVTRFNSFRCCGIEQIVSKKTAITLARSRQKKIKTKEHIGYTGDDYIAPS